MENAKEWWRGRERKRRRQRTVNATLTVNSFPRITYTQNEIMDTKIGAVVHSAENRTELTRARGHQNQDRGSIRDVNASKNCG